MMKVKMDSRISVDERAERNGTVNDDRVAVDDHHGNELLALIVTQCIGGRGQASGRRLDGQREAIESPDRVGVREEFSVVNVVAIVVRRTLAQKNLFGHVGDAVVRVCDVRSNEFRRPSVGGSRKVFFSKKRDKGAVGVLGWMRTHRLLLSVGAFETIFSRMHFCVNENCIDSS
jgi:hypothetical protein